MIKTKIYRYLGRNGILNTYILLDGINHILRYRLEADKGKILTNGEKRVYSIEINAEDLENWIEITDYSQEQ